LQKVGKNTVIPFKQDSDLFYRIGVRYANKRLFSTSIKYLEKAVTAEPFNADYQFNYACVLAELKESKKSNLTLMNILKNIDPTLTECYFGIGCNYFDMGSLKKAKEYFEKYIYFDPTGQFVDEAYDIIYYLQIYENVGPSKNSSKYFSKIAKEGKELLKNGQFLKACTKLEKTIEIDPEAATPRNDLSIALYCAGNETRAISMAKSVLKLDAENVTANCNLLLFYATSRMLKEYNEQLKVVSGLEANDKENFIKILDTFIKLEDHLNIIRIMINYLKENTEPIFYHLVAIAFFNLKQHENSRDIWDSMNSCYPQYNLIANYFTKINNAVLEGKSKCENLDYTTKLPEQDEILFMNKLKQVISSELLQIKEFWKNDREFKDILQYYLYEGSIDIKRNIIEVIHKANDDEMILILTAMLDQVYVSKEVKNFIIKTLGIKNHNINTFDNEKSDLQIVKALKIAHSEWQKEWDAVIDCALMKSEFSYRSNYKRELKSIWLNLVEKNKIKGIPNIKKHEIWAAVIEYIYCSNHLIRVSKKSIAKKYNISTTSLSSKLKDYET
jgi:tetratricopeptide (TPR) repeat protein